MNNIMDLLIPATKETLFQYEVRLIQEKICQYRFLVANFEQCLDVFRRIITNTRSYNTIISIMENGQTRKMYDITTDNIENRNLYNETFDRGYTMYELCMIVLNRSPEYVLRQFLKGKFLKTDLIFFRKRIMCVRDTTELWEAFVQHWEHKADMRLIQHIINASNEKPIHIDYDKLLSNVECSRTGNELSETELQILNSKYHFDLTGKEVIIAKKVTL